MDELLNRLLGYQLPQPNAPAYFEGDTSAIQRQAQQSGLLSAAMALLETGGPSQQRTNLGQAISRGVGSYQQGVSGSFDQALKDMLALQQMQDKRRERTTKEQQAAALEQYISSLPADQQAAARAFPEKSAEAMFREQKAAPGVVGEFNAAKAAGLLPANMTLSQYIDSKRPPGTNVTVNMDKGVAAQVGPMLKDSQIAASGAALQVDAADRVIQAIDSGKVLAGPGTSSVMKLAQFGSVLGVTGANTDEVIANTRQAIRGLAEMTLQGRKSMRGEGSITESEGALAQRAFSGDVADLTAAELKMLANASKRAANFALSQHNKKLDVLRKNPATADLVPFYEVNMLPPAAADVDLRSAAQRELDRRRKQ